MLTFLEFEKPIAELESKIEELRHLTHNGDIKATLLGMLEPLSAKAWPDECLMSPCDLSAINWLLMANDTTPLRGPLLTRLRVIEVPLPKPDHFPSIITTIRRDLANELRVPIENLPELSRPAELKLQNAFRRGISLRRIKAAVGAAMRVPDGVPERCLH